VESAGAGKMRFTIVEIREDKSGTGSRTYLTLSCGHVIEEWYCVACVGQFRECNKCNAKNDW
jgi:hypothetical protein